MQMLIWVQFSSVAQSCPTVWDPMNCSTPGLPIHHQLLEFTQTHVHRFGKAILSFVVPFSSCPQSLPASGSLPMSQLFSWGGQSIGASASASVLPMNIQGWWPLGLTGLIFLHSKGLSRVFSNTTVQKHQFFSAQLSSQSNSLAPAKIQVSLNRKNMCQENKIWNKIFFQPRKISPQK